MAAAFDAAPVIAIRPARPDDCEQMHRALLGIARFVGEEHKMKSTAADLLLHGFGDDPRFEGLIAEVDGAFAGMCLFFPSFSTWNGRPGVYVQDLFVDERFRGIGVGERLMRKVAALTLARGGSYVRLAVDTRNFRAQRFYSGLGVEFSDTEQIHAAYGEAFLSLAGAEGKDG